MTAVVSPCLLHERAISDLFWFIVVKASEEFSFLWFGNKDTGFQSDGRQQVGCLVYFNVRNDMQFFSLLNLHTPQ